MIISDNAKPEKNKFQSLISRMDKFLNDDAAVHEDYYTGRSGNFLEKMFSMQFKSAQKEQNFRGLFSWFQERVSLILLQTIILELR